MRERHQSLRTLKLYKSIISPQLLFLLLPTGIVVSVRTGQLIVFMANSKLLFVWG